MNFQECSKSNSNKIVSVKERGKSFTINNPKERIINKVTVDGCLIKDGRKRCDYLFEIDDPMTEVFYLELKGRHINHALEQLIATITYCKCKERHSKCKKFCYIVTSTVPKARPKTQTLKKAIEDNYKAQLYISTREHEVKI